jgi:hypothetical protein
MGARSAAGYAEGPARPHGARASARGRDRSVAQRFVPPPTKWAAELPGSKPLSPPTRLLAFGVWPLLPAG